MGIVDRRAEDESVRLLAFGAKLVDGIVEDASAVSRQRPRAMQPAAGLAPIQKISLSIPCASSVVATSASARWMQPFLCGFR
ncbi:MAG: hypothetical protein ACLVKA_03700 [Collinsella aerofaciens]